MICFVVYRGSRIDFIKLDGYQLLIIELLGLLYKANRTLILLVTILSSSKLITLLLVALPIETLI